MSGKSLTNFDLRKALDDSIERDEIARDRIIDKVGVWGPMLIPLIPAGLTLAAIGSNYAKLLHFPVWASWPIGVVAGGGIEVFGIIANENYLDMQRFNQTLQDGEESAPVEDAKQARDTYVKIVVGLMVTLEVIPALVNVIGAPQVIATISVLISLFPLVYLAVLTGQVIIMRKQHRSRTRARHNRIEKAEIDKANDGIINGLNGQIQTLTQTIDTLRGELSDAVSGKRSAEAFAEGLRGRLATLEHELAIAQAKASVPVAIVTGVSEPVSDDVGTVSPEVRRPEVLKLLTQTKTKSEVNFAEWGRTFGTSDTTIRNDLKWLIQQGYWQNGDTWKALPKAAELIGEVVNAN